MKDFHQWLAERAPFDPENDDPVDDPNYKQNVFDVPVDPEHFISFGTLPTEHPGQPKPKPKPKPSPSQSQGGPQQPWPYDPAKPYATIPVPSAMAKPDKPYDQTMPLAFGYKPSVAKPSVAKPPLPEVPELPKPVLPNPLPRVDSPVKRSEATKVMSKYRRAFLEKFGVPVSVGKEIIKRYGHPKHRAVDLYQYLANEPSIDVEEEVRVAKAQIVHDRAKYRGW